MIKFKPDPKPNYFVEKIAKKAATQREKTNAMRSNAFFYKSVWNSAKKRVCFECGTPIPGFDKRHCHHLILKSKQKEYSISLDNTENGILLCAVCHSKVHTNIDFAPKTQAQTFIMQKKYEQFKIKK
jgi:hypothetical protein